MTSFSVNLDKLYVLGKRSQTWTNFIMGVIVNLLNNNAENSKHEPMPAAFCNAINVRCLRHANCLNILLDGVRCRARQGIEPVTSRSWSRRVTRYTQTRPTRKSIQTRLLPCIWLGVNNPEICVYLYFTWPHSKYYILCALKCIKTSGVLRFQTKVLSW